MADGQDVPEKLCPDFARRQEITGMMSHLSAIKSAVLDTCEKRDRIYADVNAAAFQAAMDNTRRELRVTVLYALCSARGCKFCHGRGCVAEFIWKQAIPEDVKKKAAKE